MRQWLLALIPMAVSAGPTLSPVVGISLSNLILTQTTADSQGNIIIAGTAVGCSLPVVRPLSTCGSMWVAKLDPSGQTIQFATYIGSPQPANTWIVSVVGLAADASGNITVASLVSPANPLPVVNAIQPVSKGAGLYLFKLPPDGSRLIYATYLGGSGGDTPQSLTVDAAGSAYVLVSTVSTDFPTTPQSLTLPDRLRSVVVKLSPDGQTLGYASAIGDGYNFQPLAVDATGAVWTVSHGSVLKLSADGTGWQTFTLPAWSGSAPILLPTPDGGYWLTGTTSSTNLPVTPTAAQSTSGVLPYLRIETDQVFPPATPIPATQVFHFAIDPVEPWRLYAATDAGLYKSEDNGWTWGQLNPLPCLSVAVDPFNQNKLYLGTNNQRPPVSDTMYISTDRGQSWSASSQGLASFYSVGSIVADPNVGGLIYAVQQSGGAFRSKDGGSTWQAVPLPQPYQAYPDGSGGLGTRALLLRVDPSTANRIYVLADTSSIGFGSIGHSLFESDDAGLTMTSVPYGAPVILGGGASAAGSDIAVDPTSGNVYLLDYGRLIRNDRSGATATLASGLVAMALDLANPGTIYASRSDGSVVMSADSGASWNTFATTPVVASVLTVSAGSVLQVGREGSVSNAFAFKYDVANNPTYGTYWGGGSTMASTAALAVDGRLIVGGSSGPGFLTRNAAQATIAGASDGFVVEFNPSGVVLHSTFIGGAGADEVDVVVPLADGSIFVAGKTSAQGIPGEQASALGTGTSFVARLRP